MRVCAWGLHRTEAAVAVKDLSAQSCVAVDGCERAAMSVRCKAQRWVLRVLKRAGCWSWGKQESWPRAHPSAGCLLEGSASPAKEQLNSPVPDPWFVLDLQVALKEKKRHIH